MKSFLGAIDDEWKFILSENGFRKIESIFTTHGEHQVFGNGGFLIRFSKDFLGIDSIGEDIQVSLSGPKTLISAEKWHSLLPPFDKSSDWLQLLDFKPEMSSDELMAYSLSQYEKQQKRDEILLASIVNYEKSISEPISDQRSLRAERDLFIQSIPSIEKYFGTSIKLTR